MKQGKPLQEVKFLAGTVVFALVLMVFSMRTILVEPSTSPSSGNPRSPASQNESQNQGLSGATGAGQLETLTWDCKDAKDVPQVKSTHLRVKSRYCDKGEPVELLVSNQTNGYTAAVFLSPKGFSTDFIDLKDGANTILVKWKNAKGQTVERAIAVFKIPAPIASEGVQDSSAN